MTDFQTAYTKHVHHFLAEIWPLESEVQSLIGQPGEEPQRFGPGLVTDLCRCGHERGSHWDGEGSCDPAECGCRIFRDQQA
jgi:hypothetical protein